LMRVAAAFRGVTVAPMPAGHRLLALSDVPDRRKFAGPVQKVLERHHTIEPWNIARGTPTPNQCIVEVAYAVGLINDSRRESLLDALGAKPRAETIGKQRSAAVPHWDEAARELWFQGKVVRVVRRPKQAHDIVTILRAFAAAGWPPRRACRRRRDGMAAKTIYTELTVVRQWLNFTVTRRMLAASPVAGTKLVKPELDRAAAAG
jgi:hypothetical protein